MKKTSNILITILLISTFFIACKKDKTIKKDSYPEPTQKGADVIAYRVNGKAIIVKGLQARAGIMAVYNGDKPKDISIVIGAHQMDADNKKTNDLSIILHIKEPITLNTPIELRSQELINADSYIDGGYASYTNLADMSEWGVTQNEDPGQIIITRNDSGILSGTFSFKAFNYNVPGKHLEITDGVFDIR